MTDEVTESWGFRPTGELSKRWPLTDTGEYVQPAFLCRCKNLDLGDEIKINMLEAYGIPCLRLYPGDGSFGKLILGMSGEGTDIYVPETLLEDAIALSTAEETEE